MQWASWSLSKSRSFHCLGEVNPAGCQCHRCSSRTTIFRSLNFLDGNTNHLLSRSISFQGFWPVYMVSWCPRKHRSSVLTGYGAFKIQFAWKSLANGHTRTPPLFILGCVAQIRAICRHLLYLNDHAHLCLPWSHRLRHCYDAGAIITLQTLLFFSPGDSGKYFAKMPTLLTESPS